MIKFKINAIQIKTKIIIKLKLINNKHLNHISIKLLINFLIINNRSLIIILKIKIIIIHIKI